ncbi:MAG: bifunctional phosphoribosylaminoimidazolecarboxamide formyltransferase/IMP cyclohydrolase [Proteobacteria bacterium]|nr:bifunctional phosphoribosylaminoimidazolecarboxamide formyltransferase/IMP cyclohydrolase [Pseudomonadota bacterium]
MSKDRYALISVTDKAGVLDFAKGLSQEGFRILSTGGTSDLLKKSGLDVIDVADFTGSPECLDGRVKTLHPKVHAGILADRSNVNHMKSMKEFNFDLIEVVAVNLYDFAGNASGKNMDLEQAIKFIDIGGPTMLRGAAKNFSHVYSVIDPNDYPLVLECIRGERSADTLRKTLAGKVFSHISRYDALIANEFHKSIASTSAEMKNQLGTVSELPTSIDLNLVKKNSLRYGENAHQKAALYGPIGRSEGLIAASIIQGKELSYNNYVDLDAAAAIVADLAPSPACTIIKHTNPCGTAVLESGSSKDLFASALSSDPKCAFGGIVAFNVEVDESAALLLAEIFLECIIAPGFSAAALKILSAKKNLRVMISDVTTKQGRSTERFLRPIAGGYLLQDQDIEKIDSNKWKCLSKISPQKHQLKELEFAMTICRHVKSNAIVIAKEGRSIGIGAGQMSRIDSARIAIEKAKEIGHSPCHSVVASDAFFPFRDTVDYLANAGVSAIVHPGGSLKDQESIDAANEHGIVMMQCEYRHFKH